MEERFFWARIGVFYLFGAVLGMTVAAKLDAPPMLFVTTKLGLPEGCFIGLSGVAIGLVSAVGGDRFWFGMADTFRWHR